MSLNLSNQTTSDIEPLWKSKPDVRNDILQEKFAKESQIANGYVLNVDVTDSSQKVEETSNDIETTDHPPGFCNGLLENVSVRTQELSLTPSPMAKPESKCENNNSSNSQLTVPSAENCNNETNTTESCHLMPLASGYELEDPIEYVEYESELQMPQIMSLITKDLSEPYSIYTYRYFIHNWPKLCFLAMHKGECVGAIVCKLDFHKKHCKRGYIAMLAVAQGYRRKGIGSYLVIRAIKGMVSDNCDEVVLETEITNQAALHLYENLGFVRDKRLFRYYLNGVDALRLKLWLK